MKTLKALLLGLCLAAPVAADVYRVTDLAGGINDSVPSNQISDSEAASIINMHVDPISRGLNQRRGSSKQNTTQLSGNVAVDPFSHIQSDGDSYLISVASRTIAYSTSNGSTWTNLVTTMTVAAVWDGTSFVDDSFYMVNQNDGGWVFSGTSFIRAGSMPSGKFIEPYQNRLFVANTAATPYRVFFSGLLQPSTWTTSTDYFDMPEAVTCVGEPFDGGLPIYTRNTTWMLRGTSPTDFTLSQVSGQIGCADNRDVQNFDINGTEYQVFLSFGPNGSRRSLYALLGNRVVDLGRKVPNLFDGISVFDSSSRLHEWDTASDFSAGTNSQTLVSADEEAVKLSTYTQTDSLGSDFASGTMVNVTTGIVSGRLHLAVNNGNFTNNSFETNGGSGCLMTFTGWTQNESGGGCVGGTTFGSCIDGSECAGFTGVGTTATFLGVEILTPGDVLLGNLGNDIVGLGAGWSQLTKDISSYIGRYVKIRFRQTDDVGSRYLTLDTPVMLSTGPFTYYARTQTTISEIDYLQGGVSTIFNSTFTSRTFDTTVSSAAFLSSTVGGAANGNSLVFYTQESSDGSSWDTAVAWSTGTVPGSINRKRYKRYIVNISTGGTTNSTGLPYITSAVMAARATTGTYTSDIRDGSTDIASWDTFSASTSSATTEFSYRTGATTSAVVAAGWTSINPGGDVSGSARYFQWKADLTMTSAATPSDPSVLSVQQNYTASSGAQQPGDMEAWDNNLWMTYTSTGSSYNDAIIVMNEEGKFSKFTGLNVYGFAPHNGRFLSGTSLKDGVLGGYVRQLDVGTTDDGTAVTSSVVFKNYDFTPVEDYEKELSLVYFSYGAATGNFTATINENFSDVSTPYTIDFAAHNTVGRWKLETNPGTTARQFGLAFSNSQSGSRLNLYPPFTYHITQTGLIPQP